MSYINRSTLPVRLLAHGIIDVILCPPLRSTCLISGDISLTHDELFNDIDIVRVTNQVLSAAVVGRCQFADLFSNCFNERLGHCFI